VSPRTIPNFHSILLTINPNDRGLA
jgi:hypothetical protein